jgi:hypothetical protein
MNKTLLAMKKGIFIFLIVLFQFAFVEAKQNNASEEIDILISSAGNQNTSISRNPASISVDITGHVLSVNVNEDLGIVCLMVSDANTGVWIELGNMTSTPETTYFYIADTGNYRIDIVLSNGEQYYGYFSVYNGIIIN